MSPYAVDELILGSTDAVRVAVIGQALCAGFPSPADDFLESALELPRWLVPNPPATFLMQIRGESMRGAGIHDRDLACIDRSLRAEDGSVVVAVVDGQLSCKRYRMAGNRARLDSGNTEIVRRRAGQKQIQVSRCHHSIAWHHRQYLARESGGNLAGAFSR